MSEQIKLRVIEHEGIGNRTVMYNNTTPFPLLAGDDAGAPDLCCGKCGFVLVREIHQHRFVDLNEAAYAGTKVLRLSPVAQGPVFTDETHVIPSKAANIEAAVLSCPACHANNVTLWL